jgi:DNA invertase Pin-like site-specific DNA recombinase
LKPSDSGKAATYARSSKDRSDISPAAQRRALEQLAASRSLAIVETFEDAVESGATEDRPGFQRLIRAIKDPARTWSTLLVYDTSRIARRRYIAQAFKFELKKRGIVLLYSTRPADVDPISEVVLDSMLEAMDEVHSMISREKGLAGMRENVRRGFRAGGRAPFGYQLAHTPTGAIRDGRPVTKSRLEPSELAHQVAGYLKARAQGVPRVVARRAASLDLAEHSLVGVEWNALTYAGHTVWNVHREPGSGTKRRPRSEWEISRETHRALITELEAETILSNLEMSNIGAALRAARAATSRFLLSGLLYSTDGRAWSGHGQHYRLRKCGDRAGRIVPVDVVDQAVTQTLQTFRSSEAYLTWLQGEAHNAPAAAAPGADLVAQIRKLERERERAATAAIAGDDGGVYRSLVEQRTRQVVALQRELAALEREATDCDQLHNLNADELRELVEMPADPVRVVRTLIDRVVLEPDLACQIRLRRTSYNGLWRGVASPGRFEAQTQGLMLRVALRKRA